ncbi:MAG: hypothetical protein AABP62_21300 [Planctomycetota bacterium]
MITNDAELSQSMEQLERMYRALAALRRDVYPVSPQQFALLAEGPEEEIRRLQEAIDIYTGRIELAELHT